MIGFKATWKQRRITQILPLLKWMLKKLVKAYDELADKAIREHPCWAGGYSETEGICKQPCDVCDPFYKDVAFASHLGSAIREREKIRPNVLEDK